MGGSPRPFATRQTPLDTGVPVPLQAYLDDSTLVMTVVFDRMLTPAPVLDTANWFAIAPIPFPTLRTFTATAASALGTKVTAQMVDSSPGSGNTRARYIPPPADVLGADGSPAALDANIPLVVT